MNTTKKFLTADWHFGDDRFEIMQRPFKTVENMFQTIKKNHNEVVSANDIVYVVGDVCYSKTPEWLSRVSELNGRKILIKGNHDKDIPDEEFTKYFERIIQDGDSVVDSFGGLECNIVHYPSLCRTDIFNLVGHIHSAWKFQLNCMNVGVDANHFTPVDSDKIPFSLKAISEFYDADVWTAYSEPNEKYRDVRGKKSSYFSK